MANNTDRFLSRVNARIMSCAQRTLDEIGYTLDDLESLAEQHLDRDDILACIAEIKEKGKKAATELWTTANHWSEHFDGLGGGDTDSAKEENDNAKQEETTDGSDDEE